MTIPRFDVKVEELLLNDPKWQDLAEEIGEGRIRILIREGRYYNVGVESERKVRPPASRNAR